MSFEVVLCSVKFYRTFNLSTIKLEYAKRLERCLSYAHKCIYKQCMYKMSRVVRKSDFAYESDQSIKSFENVEFDIMQH